MKTAIFASVFALIVSVSAEFPACAVPCATEAVKNSECTLIDYKCLCESAAYGVSFSTCVLASCSEADSQATHNFAAKTCALYGITVPSRVISTAVIETSAATTPAATTPAATTPAAATPATGATTDAVTTAVTGPATVTVTASATGTTTGSTAGTGTSAGDTVKMVGSGFAAAAAIAAALFIL